MDRKIKQFISELETIDPTKAEIIKSLYSLFYLVSPDLEEKFIYGGIGFYIKNVLIGGLYVSSKHVSLVFSRGNELTDKYSVLQGEGKWRRHITLQNVEEIEKKRCKYYIEQIIQIEKESL